MNFLLDQSAEARISDFLISLGHDAKRIGRDFPGGLPDEQVLAIAQSEQRILITNDSDFGELIFNKKFPHSGVIFFRLGSSSIIKEKTDWLKKLLLTHKGQLNKFVVIKPNGIRIKSQRNI